MHTGILTLGLITLLATPACQTTRKAVVPPGAALETLKLTCRASSPATFECPTETIRAVGHALIDAQSDLDRGGLDVRACTADLDGCRADLEKWYRKWYITIPLGILVGGGVGIGLALGAGL